MISRLNGWVARQFAKDSGMARDLMLTLGARAFVMTAGIISSVITARVLGVQGRGEYFYVITLAQLCAQFGHLGLASSNTYIVARERAALAGLAANSLWISLVVGILTALAIMSVEHASGSAHLPELTVVVPLLAPALIYGMLANSLLIGLGRSRDYNAFTMLSTGFQLAAIFATALIGGGTVAMLWVSTAAMLLAAAGLLYHLRRIGACEWRFNRRLLCENIGYSARVYVATLVPFVVARLNVLMLFAWADASDLGYYSVAVQVFAALVVIPSTTAMLLFPELVKSEGQLRLQRMRKIAAFVALMMLAVSVMVAAAAPWVLPALFGPAFEPTVTVLWWLLPGLVSFSILNIVSQYLAAEGFPASSLWAWIGSLPVLAGAGAMLIPRHGAAGAAMALSVTYALLAIALITSAAIHHASCRSWGKRKTVGEDT